MSLSVSQTQLRGALTELLRRWEHAGDSWKDPMSAGFEKDFLVPLEPRIKATMAAMDHMSDIMARARRECS